MAAHGQVRPPTLYISTTQFTNQQFTIFPIPRGNNVDPIKSKILKHIQITLIQKLYFWQLKDCKRMHIKCLKTCIFDHCMPIRQLHVQS